MAWKDDRFEHSKLWIGATSKIIKKLDKSDIGLSRAIFMGEFGYLFDKLSYNEDAISSLFSAWLVTCYHKNNMPLIEWYLKSYTSTLTDDEKEVLSSYNGTKWGLFKVESHTEKELKLIDTFGKNFVVEPVDLQHLENDTIFFTRLNSKGNGKYFLPTKLLMMNKEAFVAVSKHNKFKDSWSKYLVGFEQYLINEYGLKERTASDHENNIELFMMYLDDTLVQSFNDIKKSMLKSDFKRFVKKCIANKVDLDRIYYSLYKFFDYLSEVKKINNKEVSDWLNRRIH